MDGDALIWSPQPPPTSTTHGVVASRPTSRMIRYLTLARPRLRRAVHCRHFGATCAPACCHPRIASRRSPLAGGVRNCGLRWTPAAHLPGAQRDGVSPSNVGAVGRASWSCHRTYRTRATISTSTSAVSFWSSRRKLHRRPLSRPRLLVATRGRADAYAPATCRWPITCRRGARGGTGRSSVPR
jgi:hypothetical protein